MYVDNVRFILRGNNIMIRSNLPENNTACMHLMNYDYDDIIPSILQESNIIMPKLFY